MAHLLEFLHTISKLKQVKRAGWVLRGVQAPESVADHSWRMALMATVLGGQNTRRIKMALVHDLAEVIVGDITPDDDVPEVEKHRREARAMNDICQINADGTYDSALQEILELWQEYDRGETPDAKFVKDLDKLEMLLTAKEYEQEQSLDLQEFFDSTEGKWRTEEIQALAELLVKQRAQP